MEALFAAIALLAGLVAGLGLGYLLIGRAAKAAQAQLERRIQELSTELAAVRSALADSQAESAARAGFEALASERERGILQLNAERNGLRGELQTKSDALSSAQKTIGELATQLENEKKNLAEKIALLESAKQTLANQFEALAAKILEEKTKTFSDANQKELGTLLTPLRDQIKDFREKVEKAQSDSNIGVTKLETLIGTLGGLNQQLSEEAHNLTIALRGSSKAQGDWGEFILRDLLEKAGLREGEQYSFQQSFSGVNGEDGARAKTARTDVIVHFPGDRHLVIDSKVSLKAYTDSVNAETEEERKAALREHIKSLHGHIGGLAKSGYHNLPGIETPDFVVMFVPIEPALLIALQSDSSLWTDAYAQGILLVGPTTLLYIIRIVNVLWDQETQARNVKEVMERGAELYDKFVGFVNDLESVGKSLRGADASYSNAMKKLTEGRGNLVRQVEMLKELGVRPGKALPRNLLDSAGFEESGLALAAGADEPAAE
jgi:DNA recombination protein RmuC